MSVTDEQIAEIKALVAKAADRDRTRAALKEMRDRIIYLDGQVKELAEILEQSLKIGAKMSREIEVLRRRGSGDLVSRRSAPHG